MKSICTCVISGAILFMSCRNGENNRKDTVIPSTTETSVPGIEKLNFTDTVGLKAGEDMRFDRELFRVKAGKKIRLILHNTSRSMTHNVVILKPGTDIADFADAVHNAKDEQYTPSSVSPLMIAHTKIVGAGESDAMEFIIPQAGVYDFICSFPGHWGTMQGKIVAE